MSINQSKTVDSFDGILIHHNQRLFKMMVSNFVKVSEKEICNFRNDSRKSTEDTAKIWLKIILREKN